MRGSGEPVNCKKKVSARMPDYKQLIERLLRRAGEVVPGHPDQKMLSEAAASIERLEYEAKTAKGEAHYAHTKAREERTKLIDQAADAVKFAEAQYEEVCAERDRLVSASKKAVYMGYCKTCGLAESNSATAEYPTVCRNCGSTDLSQYIKFKAEDFAVFREAQKR